MNVRLISISKPAIPECSSPEDLIAYAARVSNPSNQANSETAPRLLKYLVKNHHWSPFEMAHMVLEIETTRDIGRQILRHRSFSFQECSQRYAEVQAEPVIREARMQHATNRQASVETDDGELASAWEQCQREVAAYTAACYEWALEAGIAKEVARAVLPEGLTPSRLYMAGNVRSWIHYIAERTAAGTQKEHREVARACRAILLDQFPSLSEVID